MQDQSQKNSGLTWKEAKSLSAAFGGEFSPRQVYRIGRVVSAVVALDRARERLSAPKAPER